MSTVLMQELEYLEQDVFDGFKQYDRMANVYIRRLIYYPYYFFEFELSAKSLINLNGKIACSIDGISGHGAIIDVKPAFSYREIETEGKLPIQIGKDEARKAAERFTFQTISQKTKFITIPNLQVSNSSLFYRPYWLAEYSMNGIGEQQLIVDAISGSYHPI
ncbi:hypothetical protein DFO73_10927 [Cytobacillus oceanisediminis]|jgi:hypothetical protein|uniref:Uncharacterized protein n=1 Tax=Cytobacillus oceanisediminis TaxID=665099 RepID=A0A2V2ZS96_9BACI|nr:hypothetical protein [Cytobacillus oceanisediminis]PWW26864.1 hypothetical protein DFO73_10927 [Cytobacillus oceanisediminis]